ncbi:hypothetical protein IMZ31_20825 (plasmid) [Pontibacillus sp. ALD_SL1]|uniref:hypothetical protein n=1 Tax=Pontibacillus sp. ALD_SL1 TaxID=2777185 RepID=UPI001A968D08|nr:hypothetical protein [Pontibacillus sp. ALD_SL1]QST02994.1 hypothetical protein IMZ31_20825 [Pontibacillus sp. ALD_SL1]
MNQPAKTRAFSYKQKQTSQKVIDTPQLETKQENIKETVPPKKSRKNDKSSEKPAQPKQEKPKDMSLEYYKGKSVEDIVFENRQLRRVRDQMSEQILGLNDEVKEVRSILQEKIRKCVLLHTEVTEPIVCQFEVHPDDSDYQENFENIEKLAGAIRWIESCFMPSENDYVAEIQKLKRALEETDQALRELKKNPRDVKAPASQKGTRVVAHKKMLHSLSPQELKDIFLSQFSRDEILDLFKTLKEQKLKEQAQNGAPASQPAAQNSDSEKAFQQKVEQPKAKYWMLLEEKGYKPTPADQKNIDAYVWSGDQKVPLSYIDYDIADYTDFDKIMGKTDQIYLLFDSKQHKDKGNTNFTSWLLKKAKERKKHISFSFTTLDDLKVSGLDDLDTL